MDERWIVIVGVALVGWARARSDRRRARHWQRECIGVAAREDGGSLRQPFRYIAV